MKTIFFLALSECQSSFWWKLVYLFSSDVNDIKNNWSINLKTAKLIVLSDILYTKVTF
jgi:hypothetical protein